LTGFFLTHAELYALIIAGTLLSAASLSGWWLARRSRRRRERT
jgi:hypothetical protein